MPRARIINRNYACRECGTMRRAPAHHVPNAPPAPSCCGQAMQVLSYEQTVAATDLTHPQRVDWLAAGGKVAKRSGKRRWKAVW